MGGNLPECTVPGCMAVEQCCSEVQCTAPDVLCTALLADAKKSGGGTYGNDWDMKTCIFGGGRGNRGMLVCARV